MSRLSLFAIIAIVIGSSARADDDFPLTSLLGDDVGLCVEVTDLHRQLDQLQNSELATRIRGMSMFQALAGGAQMQSLQAARTWVKSVVGKGPREFASDLLGQSVVLGISPSEGEPTGLFLTRATNEAALTEFISVWKRADLTGVFEPRQHAGREYTHRSRNGSDEKVFYALLGTVMAISDHEASVKSAIDRYVAIQTGKAKAGFLDAPAMKTAQAALATENLIKVLVNPRAWDKTIARESDKSREQQIFGEVWQRCRWLAGGMRMDQGLGVELLVDYTSKGAPKAWSQFVDRTDADPDFLNRVPSNALVSIAGRHDLSALFAFAMNQVPSKQQEVFNGIAQNVLGMPPAELVNQLPPNWGLFVVPRRELELNVVPVNGVFALQIPPADTDDGRKCRRAIDQGLSMGFVGVSVMLATKFEKPARAVTNSQEHPNLKWIENLGPHEVAASIGAEYLAVGSDREDVKPFLAKPEELAANGLLEEVKQQRFPQANHVLFVNAKAARDFVNANRPFFVKQATQLGPGGEQRLSKVEEAMSLVDAGYASLRISPKRIRLSAGLYLESSADAEASEE